MTPPKGPDDDELPTLKERSPVMFWVAVVAIVALVLGSTGGVILLTIL